MGQLKRIGFFILTLAVFNTAFAETKITCDPAKITVQNKNILLPGPEKAGTFQVYFFKNLGKQGIWIDHPVAHASASAGWSSYLRVGNWSAFLLSRKDFVVNCAVIQPGHVKVLNCEEAVSVCVPKEAVFKTPSKTKGSYWLAEDQSWDEMIKAVEKRGIALK